MPAAPIRLLVVEEQPRELKLIEGALSGRFELRAAHTPSEALELLRSSAFDMVLVNNELKEMSGAELLSQARVVQPSSNRVLITAPEDAGALVAAMEQGDVHHFVSKPVSAEALLAVAERLQYETIPGLKSCVVLDADGERGKRLATSLDATGIFLGLPQDKLTPGQKPALVLMVQPASAQEVTRVLHALGGRERQTALIILLEATSSADAAPFLGAGADDVVWLPLRPEEIRLRYKTWRSKRVIQDEAERVRSELLAGQPFVDVVGRSDAMRQVFSAVHRVAATDATVMLCGETGTGKELLAHTIHALSARSKAPFVAVNLSALPETLIESELFGHEPGAFTGAQTRRDGRLEKVSGGTLFLDEIGDLQPQVQVKLLRVLEERKFERLGSNVSRDANFRLVCATHRNLEQLIAEGKFREDLYYRVNVVRVDVPPLRERGDDVLLLSEHFLQRYAKRDKKKLRFAEHAAEAFLRHTWPGNVRELQHVVERAVALCKSDVVDPELMPPRGPRKSFRAVTDKFSEGGRGLREVLLDIEKTILVETLEHYQGNQVNAAKKLKIPRQTLQHRLRKLGL